MAGGLSVDAQAIMTAGDGVASAAEAVQAEVKAFQAELREFGEPWGNDDLGSLVGTVYQAISAIAMECYGVNTGQIVEIGGLVKMMGAKYLNTEQDNVNNINSYREILG